MPTVDQRMILKRKMELMLMGMRHIRNKRKRLTKGNGKRRWWVHPILRQRSTEGAWCSLFEKFRSLYPDKHRQCLRVNKAMFDHILALIQQDITKQDTRLRQAIPANQRLAVTLLYLSTGDSFRSIALLFRIGESTAQEIVYETCKALWARLQPIYLKTPSTKEEWLEISHGFNQAWNFPNCLGAIDGKHCTIQAPPNSGSEYFNYKKSFSLVLMALCDSQYRFTYVDTGMAGRWSDGGTFDNCSLNHALSEGMLNMPDPTCLPGSLSQFELTNGYHFIVTAKH